MKKYKYISKFDFDLYRGQIRVMYWITDIIYMCLMLHEREWNYYES